MQKRYFRVALLFLLLMNFYRIYLVALATMLSVAASSQENAVTSFNQYYLKSVDKLRDLYNVRGAAFVCENMSNPYREVKAMLQGYRNVSRFLGILFYSYNNDSLRIWLLRTDTLVYHQQIVQKDQLVKAEVDLRRALKVDLLLAARDAKNRGVTINIKDEPRPDVAESIATATGYLLPQPIAKTLKGLKHLIVIPEFNISQFPWYLLKPYNNNAYLVDSVSVSLAPHLCNLTVTLEQYDNYVGNPVSLVVNNAVVVGNPSYAHNRDVELSQLPGAEMEADTIAAMLNTVALKGKEATLSNVLQKAKGADFLYFATHGYADLEKGLAGSFLAFAPDSTSPNGLWNAKQIQNEKITAKASMAILSACQTGVGKIYDAGFIGIGRAFYKAGIDHTIMSLWSVSDTATQKLMTSFVTILKTQELYFYPASHLRKAILQFKKEDPDPTHWAPFMLFGFPY